MKQLNTDSAEIKLLNNSEKLNYLTVTKTDTAEIGFYENNSIQIDTEGIKL